MDYKQKYKQLEKFIKDLYPHMSDYCKEKTEGMIPELKESENERIRKWLIRDIKRSLDDDVYNDESIDNAKKALVWLEKQGEQKPIISEDAIREGVAHFGITQYQITNWLKKYINVVNQKPAWSEEDENLLKLSLDNLTELMNRFGEKYGKVGDCIDWLKSLRPQPHWKPSEEQMYILEWLTTNVLDDDVVGKTAKTVLSTLIEQLKSL